jgi:hypothetical protein
MFSSRLMPPIDIYASQGQLAPRLKKPPIKYIVTGIMLVDFAIMAERRDHLPARDAIHRAALLRFRPIMMTTLVALLGGIPLILGQGTGSEIRQPLGYAMVGGLIVSQALTLFTTPVIYLYLDQLSDWVSSWRSPVPAERHATASEGGSATVPGARFPGRENPGPSPAE